MNADIRVGADLQRKKHNHSLQFSKWRAPWKGGMCTYFVAIFQVAWNSLKFDMATLFVLKNASVFFFSRRQKNMDQVVQKSISRHCRISILGELKHCMCVFYTIGGLGGQKGGVDFQERVWSLVSPLVEKRMQGHFLIQKESAWQISVDSEQLEKSQRNRYICLPSMEPFNFSLVWRCLIGFLSPFLIFLEEKMSNNI